MAEAGDIKPEFIFTEPDVIGTPSMDIRDTSFHLVAQASLINSGKLQTRMARIGLQVSQPFPVGPDLYEACLRYTLLARISPAWNKAGPWLIQGRNFLTSTGFSNAIKMNISVHNNELYFTLEASAVKTGLLHVEDLDIPDQCLRRYMMNQSTQILHENIGADWCFVLPSMKRGRIVSMSHDLPEESPFMSYRDIKRHWKNTYGYRLPETEEDMNFYQVQFSPMAGRLFTYPEVCLRPREIQKVQRVDPKPILRAFMLDIQAKFPTICGLPLKLQSKAKFTVSELIGCNTGADCVPNLTSKMANNRSSVYRSRTEMDKLLSLQSSKPQSVGMVQHRPNLPPPSTSSKLEQRPLIQGRTGSITASAVTNNEQRPEKPAVLPNSQRQVIRQDHIKSHTSSHGNGGNMMESRIKTSVQTHPQSSDQNQILTVRQETPQQCRGRPGPGQTQNTSQDSAVARRLFPHFTPKKYSLESSQTSQVQAPATIVPVFMAKKNMSCQQIVPGKTIQTAGAVRPIFKSRYVDLMKTQQTADVTSQTKTVPMFQKNVIKNQTVHLNAGKTISGKPASKTAKNPKAEKPKKRSTKKDAGKNGPKEKRVKKAEA